MIRFEFWRKRRTRHEEIFCRF